MINTFTLTDFRNHAASRINTGGAQTVVITGPNGGGKTAVLEAISMLSGDRGLRGADFDSVARFGAPGFAVFATLSDDTEISVSFARGDANRRAKIDGDTATLSNLAGVLRIVWLTPKEDRLFVDGAADRRAFFDRLAGGFDPAHFGRVARLAKLLSERAFALRTGGDSGWLDAIDAQIAPTAVAVTASRIAYAGEINYFLENAGVRLRGMVEGLIADGNAATAEKSYLEYLADNRVLAGDKMALDGPHKSDFDAFNRILELPVNITSTGQQKAVLVDIILAHAKLINAKTGKTPIVLLDEADAHLDANARARMFAELDAAHAQVFATGIDAGLFDMPRAAFVACENGVARSILAL